MPSPRFPKLFYVFVRRVMPGVLHITYCEKILMAVASWASYDIGSLIEMRAGFYCQER